VDASTLGLWHALTTFLASPDRRGNAQYTTAPALHRLNENDLFDGVNSESLPLGTEKSQVSDMLYKVDASLTAGHLMSQIPGLRARVEEMLMGILETADAINQLQEINFESTVDAPMRVQVGNYIISYLLDVRGRKAKVVFVEMVSSEGPTPASKAG
jgi:hypothetical protein